MKIEFYEEFPNKENFKKLEFVNFPTKVFIAAKSLKEFQKYEQIAKSFKKDVECAYWPIVKNSYYPSSFSNPKDLIELFNELNSIKNPLLIDIELPIPKKLIFKNLSKIRKNKKLINGFIKKNKERITVPQQPFAILSKVFQLIGLTYPGNYEKNPMFYTSMFPNWLNNFVRKAISKYKNKNEYSIGLGTIAVGVLGNEPILPPKKLEEDLKFVKKFGFKKVVIFQLEGINKKYMEVLNKFI